jgi:hypothetical protein
MDSIRAILIRIGFGDEMMLLLLLMFRKKAD